VREQAALVAAFLAEHGESRFTDLVADADGTLVVVARFLALLELYRERALAFEQPEPLGELRVRWVAEADRAAIEVTDEFDRPPGEPSEEEQK
jgi:segregation and condensation protein A